MFFKFYPDFLLSTTQTTFNFCYQQRAWCFGLRVHTPGSVRNRIINHARRPKVNDHRGFSLFSQTSKTERTSNFFVTMSALAATRNASLHGARLRPRFSSWGRRAAQANNGPWWPTWRSPPHSPTSSSGGGGDSLSTSKPPSLNREKRFTDQTLSTSNSQSTVRLRPASCFTNKMEAPASAEEGRRPRSQ